MLGEHQAGAIAQREAGLPRERPQQPGLLGQLGVELDHLQPQRSQRLTDHHLHHTHVDQFRHYLGEVDYADYRLRQ